MITWNSTIHMRRSKSTLQIPNIHIKKVIFQGDSLSALCLGVILLSQILNIDTILQREGTNTKLTISCTWMMPSHTDYRISTDIIYLNLIIIYLKYTLLLTPIGTYRIIWHRHRNGIWNIEMQNWQYYKGNI